MHLVRTLCKYCFLCTIAPGVLFWNVTFGFVYLNAKLLPKGSFWNGNCIQGDFCFVCTLHVTIYLSTFIYYVYLLSFLI